MRHYIPCFPLLLPDGTGIVIINKKEFYTKDNILAEISRITNTSYASEGS